MIFLYTLLEYDIVVFVLCREKTKKSRKALGNIGNISIQKPPPEKSIENLKTKFKISLISTIRRTTVSESTVPSWWITASALGFVSSLNCLDCHHSVSRSCVAIEPTNIQGPSCCGEAREYFSCYFSNISWAFFYVWGSGGSISSLLPSMLGLVRTYWGTG